MKDEYLSIDREASATLKVEGSKFTALACPVASRQEADAKLKAIRKEYFDAHHHCFAYVIGCEGEDFRSSDDGEPTGTAGVRILSAIRAKDLSDVLIVVVRYFGGVKLGVGGLGRAYADAATSALSGCSTITKIVGEELLVTFPYTETSGVMNAMNRLHARIIDTTYDDDVLIRCSIRKRDAKALTGELINVTRGNIAVKQA